MSHYNNQRVWQEGDIAYLRPSAEYDQKEYGELIQARPGQRYGHLPPKATGHPVIILRRLSPTSSHVLVTPVSAYSSGPYNDFLAPWKQPCHRRKRPADFRSFEGSEQYRCSLNLPTIRLRDGGAMPKPRTSWVNIQSAFVVPLSVIGTFTKSRRHLQLDHASLQELRSDMSARCTTWKQVSAMLLSHEKQISPASNTRPVGTSPPSTTSTVRAAKNTCDWRGPGMVLSTPTTATPTSKAVKVSKSWAAIAAR